ncbi:hypothetical protein SANTM175S_05331 [Streptomyces antimycoticus]
MVGRGPQYQRAGSAPARVGSAWPAAATRHTGPVLRTTRRSRRCSDRGLRVLQDFGFELEETRPFVECLRSGHPAGDSCPASLEVYRRKLAELDECIGRLSAIRERVGTQLAQAELARAELEAAATAPEGAPEPRCELTPPGP